MPRIGRRQAQRHTFTSADAFTPDRYRLIWYRLTSTKRKQRLASHADAFVSPLQFKRFRLI